MGNVTVTIPQGRGMPIPATKPMAQFTATYIVVD